MFITIEGNGRAVWSHNVDSLIENLAVMVGACVEEHLRAFRKLLRLLIDEGLGERVSGNRKYRERDPGCESRQWQLQSHWKLLRIFVVMGANS